MGWGGEVMVVACRIILAAPVPVPFLWTLDFGLGFGTGLFAFFVDGIPKMLNVFLSTVSLNSDLFLIFELNKY